MSSKETRSGSRRSRGASAPSPLEVLMQRVSLGFSTVALLLMGAGFLEFALTPGGSLQLPGESAMAFDQILRPSSATLGLYLMSVGILILATLPAVRVLLALVLYLRQHIWRDVAAAFGVLLILLLSTRVK